MTVALDSTTKLRAALALAVALAMILSGTKKYHSKQSGLLRSEIAAAAGTFERENPEQNLVTSIQNDTNTLPAVFDDDDDDQDFVKEQEDIELLSDPDFRGQEFVFDEKGNLIIEHPDLPYVVNGSGLVWLDGGVSTDKYVEAAARQRRREARRVRRRLGETAAGNFCWKTTYGRGLGEWPTTCAGRQKIGLFCYDHCKANMRRAGFNCYSNCPDGWQDEGLYCRPSRYGRGTGYTYFLADPWGECHKHHGVGNCEELDWIVYPKCADGYHNMGCCICEGNNNCAAHNLKSGLIEELFNVCGKEVQQNRPHSMGCAGNMDQSMGICYPHCAIGYHGVGPVCWGGPPRNWVHCGLGAARDELTCASTMGGQILSTLWTAAFVVSLGNTGTVGTAVNGATVGPRMAKIQKMIDDAWAFKDWLVNMQLYKAITLSHAVSFAGWITTLSFTIDQAVSAGIVTQTWKARIFAQAISIIDPTGVYGMIGSFAYDTCDHFYTEGERDHRAASSLRTAFNTYLSDVTNAHGKLVLSTYADIHEEWTMIRLEGTENTYALKAPNGMYLGAGDDGSTYLWRNMGPYEKFTKIDDGETGLKFFLKTAHGTFLKAFEDGSLGQYNEAHGYERFYVEVPREHPIVYLMTKDAPSYVLHATDDGTLNTQRDSHDRCRFKLVEHSDGTVSVGLARHDRHLMKFLEANEHDMKIRFSETTVGPNERLKLVKNDDGTRSLQSKSGHSVELFHLKLSPTPSGLDNRFWLAQPIQSNKDETFFLSGKFFNIASYHGKYLQAKRNGEFRDTFYHDNCLEPNKVNDCTMGRMKQRDEYLDRRWEIVFNLDGTISLKTNHGKYLAQHSNGHFYAHDYIGAWEKFTLVWHADSRVSFKTHHGSYLKTSPDGSIGHYHEIHEWEKFYLLAIGSNEPEPWAEVPDNTDKTSPATFLRHQNGLFLSWSRGTPGDGADIFRPCLTHHQGERERWLVKMNIADADDDDADNKHIAKNPALKTGTKAYRSYHGLDSNGNHREGLYLALRSSFGHDFDGLAGFWETIDTDEQFNIDINF